MDKDLNKEIEEMAEKMEKASIDPKDKLFTIIKSLGAEGLKAKLSTLTDEEKVVLKAALEEMNLQKAVSFDKEAAGAKFVQGKVVDTIIQEDKADDDADEKLVKPAAAAHSHQGTPTDGWEGQVIKSINESEEKLDEVVTKAMDKCNDEMMVKEKLSKKGIDEKKVQGALDKYKQKKMKKSEADEIEKGKMKAAREDAKEKIMDMEEKEHGTKDPKKLVEAEKKEHKMKKSEETDVEKAKKMNKEEDQLGDAPEMNEKPMGKKTAAPEIEANAKANKKNMKKCLWEDENRLLKANTLGRNFHFDAGDHFEKSEKKEETAQEIKKAEVNKEDVNDLIEKSMDRNWDQVNHERAMSQVKTNGTLVKSFDDTKDLAAILGLTEEEAKKILG